MREVPTLGPAELADQPEQWATAARTELMRNRVFGLRRDRMTTPDGADHLDREYLAHPGAVGVIALDDQDRVILVRQYRHPVGYRMVEPPAGLLDLDGEAYHLAAARELAEETGLAAGDWRVLVDVFTTPGSSQESARVFLARGLRDAPRPDGFVVEHEEAHMDVVRAPFADVVAAILAGDLQSPLLVAGALALAAARAGAGEDALRPADAPWPAREQRDRVDAAG